MPVLSKPAFGPAVALGYVTGGALMCVWTAVWYFTRGSGEEITRTTWFWLSGLFLTGAVFVFLGLVLGPLGRAARQAELPPREVTRAEAAIQQTAAANPPPVAPVPGVAPGVVGAVPQAAPAAPPAATAPPVMAAYPAGVR